MNRLSQLRPQIDACRPGSDDLALPELAELARAVESDRAVAAELERSQRFDRAVSAALHEAAVPAGLAERILAAAAKPAPRRSFRFSRRWAVALAAVAALVLGAVTLAINWPRPPRTVSKEELAAMTQQWFDDAFRQTAWEPATRQSPAAFAFDQAVRIPPVRWRQHSTASGPAVVFDCTPPGGQRVLLFVIKSPSRFSVAPLPYSRLPGISKGMAAGAWQRGDLLYVLVVVEEGQQRLETLIHKPSVT